MSKPTLNSLDTRTTRLETEADIQFRDLFNRVKRLETIFISVAATIIVILLGIVAFYSITLLKH